eukprot:scaffold139047_cov63-Attheya_sp.AAC.1
MAKSTRVGHVGLGLDWDAGSGVGLERRTVAREQHVDCVLCVVPLKGLMGKETWDSLGLDVSRSLSLHPTIATSPSRSYPSIVSGNPARFYTYQPQPMGSNLSALAWRSHLGHATTPPPLIIDIDGYNSDSSAATDDMPSLSYPM